uniref:Uncharacterized protein n=1 Tax=Tanacetum cinerariifolium TaxID=118510 RepID=A0A6L2KSS1_TANCI|nr:hypothetical protein [Tanacetum cinerariifolium]
MTTSAGNNSVLRSFFEKQKLTGPNFIDWYRQLRLVLLTEDKENYLEHPIPEEPVAPPGQQVPLAVAAAHAAWVKGQKEVNVLMLLTIDLDIQRNLAHLDRERVSRVQAGRSMGKTVNELHAMLKLHEDTLPKEDANPALHAIWAGRVHKNQKINCTKLLNGLMGCEALVKHDTLTKPDKLDPRSFKCIFVGYPKGTIGYSFYNSYENKVFVAWNAEFFENDFIDLKASKSVEDLKLIQEKDTNPSLDTSLNHEEDDQKIDEPQSDINPIRKSSRIRHALDRMCLYIDAEEHKLGDLGEPINYKAPLMDLKSNKWLDVMNMEMQSMKDNDVWVLVELPPNARTVGSKWLFKKNTNMDGAVYVFKARLVAKGFTKTYGVDYEKTFSPVADIRATRILIAIAAYYDYEI